MRLKIALSKVTFWFLGRFQSLLDSPNVQEVPNDEMHRSRCHTVYFSEKLLYPWVLDRHMRNLEKGFKMIIFRNLIGSKIHSQGQIPEILILLRSRRSQSLKQPIVQPKAQPEQHCSFRHRPVITGKD